MKELNTHIYARDLLQLAPQHTEQRGPILALPRLSAVHPLHGMSRPARINITPHEFVASRPTEKHGKNRKECDENGMEISLFASVWAWQGALALS